MTSLKPEAQTLAWFHDRLRAALLARLGERMMTVRYELTPLGREVLAAEENVS